MSIGGEVLIDVKLSEDSYKVLLDILHEKFYNTTDINVLAKINNIYEQLHLKSEAWLSTIKHSN